ncbi:MAG: hypothetical protein V4726_23915 [Verrucomicrobiota bacterium]
MSPIIRIICGLGIILFSWSVYQKNSAAIAAGTPMSIGGYAPGGSPGQVATAFGVIGLIGVSMVILGIAGLVKSRK